MYFLTIKLQMWGVVSVLQPQSNPTDRAVKQSAGSTTTTHPHPLPQNWIKALRYANI